MPICIECSYPVSQLYSTYSKADDRSLGKGVRLTQCPRCKRFADKYVEHDFVVLFIDLVLIKPQVYRHLLFNRLGRDDDNFEPSIIRLGVLLLLFDVYLTWARIEKSASTPSPLSNSPIIIQYLFFLTLNASATLAQHVTVRTLASFCIPNYNANINTNNNDGNHTDETGTGLSPPPPLPPPPPPPHQSPPANPTATSTIQTHPQTKPPDPFSPINSSNTLPAANPLFPVPRQQSASTSPSHSRSRSSSPSPSTPTGPILQPTTATTTTNHHHSHTHTNSSTTTTTAIIPQLPRRPNKNSISTALLVSSCTKLFPIFLVIWGGSANTDQPAQEQQDPQQTPHPTTTTTTTTTTSITTLSTTFTTSARASVSWAVLLNNIEALLILLDCGYLRATGVAVGGALARWVVEMSVLRIAGFEGVEAEAAIVGDVFAAASWVCRVFFGE